MKVKDAMHIGVEWVVPEMPIAQIAMRMKELDIGAIPVGEHDKLIGMVTDRDIACRGFANGKSVSSLTARDVMSSGVIYCNDEEDLDEALRVMESNRIRRLPVINGKKRMVGMLSLGDISHAVSHERTGGVVEALSAHHP